MWTPCPLMHVQYARLAKESTAFTLQVHKKCILAFLLHGSLHCLGCHGISYGAQRYWMHASKLSKWLEKMLRSFGCKSGPKNATNIGNNILGTFRLRCPGALGRNFPCYVACNFRNLPCDMGWIL